MKKTMIGGILAGLLAMATSSAWAIPVMLDITHSGSGGATGFWELSGPTNASDAFVTDYSTSFEILDGDYLFEISALQGGFGTTSWLLNVGGQVVGGENHGVFLISAFQDSVRFEAVGVPEPATLGLLGATLLGLGFMRRKARA